MRLAGVKVPHQGLFITREQVRMMLEGAEAAANVDVFDRERLIRAVRFADTTVGEVMIPIAEVTMVNRQASTAEAVKLARKHGYFRLPVYEDKPGQVTGVFALTIWNLLDEHLTEKPLSDLCKQMLHVVENQPVDEVLDELQNRVDHMAIVIDEFGSAIGMITLEDVLEQVVGEVVNLGYNFEAHVPRHKGIIEKLEADRYRVDGSALVIEVAEALGISLAYPNIHTIGGLVLRELRHLPQPGESIKVSGYRFTVEAISEKGIKSIVAEPV